jgi:hypothetical protein
MRVTEPAGPKNLRMRPPFASAFILNDFREHPMHAARRPVMKMFRPAGPRLSAARHNAPHRKRLRKTAGNASHGAKVLWTPTCRDRQTRAAQQERPR